MLQAMQIAGICRDLLGFSKLAFLIPHSEVAATRCRVRGQAGGGGGGGGGEGVGFTLLSFYN